MLKLRANFEPCIVRKLARIARVVVATDAPSACDLYRQVLAARLRERRHQYAQTPARPRHSTAPRACPQKTYEIWWALRLANGLSTRREP
jgi:hypothetical protein